MQIELLLQLLFAFMTLAGVFWKGGKLEQKITDMDKTLEKVESDLDELGRRVFHLKK